METVVIDSTNEVVHSTTVLESVAVELLDQVVVVDTKESIITVSEPDSVIHTNVELSAVVLGGNQGIQGPPGDSNQSVHLISSINVGGNRLVATNSSGQLIYPDTGTFNTIIGVTKTSGSIGSLVEVQICGIMSEPSWSWDLAKPIYWTSDGILTQSVPSTGVLQIVGNPVSATSMIIDKQAPIMLG